MLHPYCVERLKYPTRAFVSLPVTRPLRGRIVLDDKPGQPGMVLCECAHDHPSTYMTRSPAAAPLPGVRWHFDLQALRPQPVTPVYSCVGSWWNRPRV